MRPGTVWLTGMSGTGKTTIGELVVARIRAAGYPAILLDGDELRKTTCADLGYTKADRDANVMRVGALAGTLNECGIFSVVALMSPFDAVRGMALRMSERRLLCYLRASVDMLRARDPKGLYARQERGEIFGLSGVDAPYEPPAAPDMTLDTDGTLTPEAAAMGIYARMQDAWRD